MEKKKYIVGIGAANADIYGNSSIKIREHYDHPSIIKTTVGGVTRNILENISRLGIQTKLLTAVGDDIYGNLVLNKSKEVGIDVDDVLVVKNANTGIFLQVQNKNNDMYLALCDMSINSNINIDYIKKKDKIIKNAYAIVLDPSLDIKVLEYIFSNYSFIPIYLDPISEVYATKIRPYLNYIYCIKPNKDELSCLANMKIKDEKSLLKAYKKVSKQVKYLFTSLGDKGCMYIDDNNEIQIRKFEPVRKMVNASGAGDSMIAAIIYGQYNGLNIENTIDYALAAGIATILDEHVINPNLSIKLINKIIKERKL